LSVTPRTVSPTESGSVCHVALYFCALLFFFFNDTATTEIYTLSLHDALPISLLHQRKEKPRRRLWSRPRPELRSEEHTSELQSLTNLVCRLLLEKKNNKQENARAIIKHDDTPPHRDWPRRV